jgi:hypothetical protein
VLERFDLSYDEILQRLHHLCESVGSRMRSQGKAARGIYVYGKSRDKGYWHSSTLTQLPFHSDATIYQLARQLFERSPDALKEIGVHCYELEPMDDPQLSLFNDQIVRERQVTDAIDDINKRWGERTIHSADTLGTGIYVHTKIPFGSTRYL